jgi:hypothetical protein
MFNRYLVAGAVMAYVVVLAEDAAEVAAGKEYRARPAGTDEDAFLAEMRAYGTNHRQGSNAAESHLTLEAMNFALSRTQHAGFHISPQLPDRFTKRIDIQRSHNFVYRSLSNPP